MKKPPENPPSIMERKGRIAIFISFSGQGGVERMTANLAFGFLEQGFEVDMVLVKSREDHLVSVPSGVRQVRLRAKHTITALPGLIRYLRSERPPVLLAVKHRAIKVAVVARWLSGQEFLLAGRLGTTVSAALEGRVRLRKWIWYTGMRIFYRYVDRIIAVSEGVAQDIRNITRLPDSRIHVVRNPVVTEKLFSLASEHVDDPWLAAGDPPLVIGMGRLTRQKGFFTLLKAFAKLRETRDCRLILLGEGELRGELESLAMTLGLSKDVRLPGFVQNPYPFLAKSSLFILSSLWEGSPNSLTESLALGIPVVSTDCRSGPSEILQDGRFGHLVPVGDEKAMCLAMTRTLDNPLPSDTLKGAVREYRLEDSVERYLKILELAKH
jgi:glycosyltransferase involved in cell wall biosynthesis